MNQPTGAVAANLPRGFLLLVAAMVAISPIAIDAYLPAMPTMALDFGVGIVEVNHTLSLYLVGFALGQLLGGPISDQIGRKRVAVFGLVAFILTTVVIVFSTRIEHVQALRLVQAIGGGLCAVVCMPMVRDAYPAREAVRKFPIVFMVMLIAPLLAPMIGSLLLPLGWQSIFVFLGLYGAFALLAFTRIPETAPNPGRHIRWRGILPQYVEVLTRRIQGRPVPLMYILGNASISCLMFVFITNSSFIYLEYFDVGEAMFPFYFGANVLSMLGFTVLASRLIRRISPALLFRIGRGVQLLFFTAFAALVFGADEIPLSLFTPLLALSMGVNGLIGPAVSGLYLTRFKRLVGSASSLMGISVFLMGGLLGALSGFLHDGTLRPMLYTMIGGIVVGNLIVLAIPRPNGALEEDHADGY